MRLASILDSVVYLMHCDGYSWTNRDDIDFSLAAELPPVQEFNLAEDVRGAVDYPTK